MEERDRRKWGNLKEKERKKERKEERKKRKKFVSKNCWKLEGVTGIKKKKKKGGKERA
jgi:hypothetical protein